jgi:prepilin-type N-terminal cleavage/methylation domain-containing protein
MLNAKKGFTLSELLVSLAVLGLIAAFAVPKVLTSVGNSTLLANAKEAISTISGAYEALKSDYNGMIPTTLGNNLTTGLPGKMSYVQIGTYTQGASGTVDVFTPAAAAAGVNSIRFANNAIMTFNTADVFTAGALGTIGRLVYNVDPDGTGPNKGFTAILGYDGRVFIPGSVALVAPFDNYVAATAGDTEVTAITPNASGAAATSAGVDYTPYYNAGMVT